MYYLYLCFLLLLGIPPVFAEEILITSSPDRDEVVFDGRWSFMWEWKRTSFTDLFYDDAAEIKLRTAHQGDFLYVFVDFVSDEVINKGSDRTLVCIDSENNKSKISDENDYCFSVALERNGFTYQGGSPLKLHGNFNKIPNHPDFIAVSAVSNEHDRYSTTPHTGFEFKIPIELFGRSNNYGFFVSVYDDHSKKTYTWPQNVELKSPFDIPSPSKWGDIISPDNTLPEFNWPIFSLVILLLVPIFLIRKINFRLNNF